MNCFISFICLFTQHVSLHVSLIRGNLNIQRFVKARFARRMLDESQEAKGPQSVKVRIDWQHSIKLVLNWSIAVHLALLFVASRNDNPLFKAVFKRLFLFSLVFRLFQVQRHANRASVNGRQLTGTIRRKTHDILAFRRLNYLNCGRNETWPREYKNSIKESLWICLTLYSEIKTSFWFSQQKNDSRSAKFEQQRSEASRRRMGVDGRVRIIYDSHCRYCCCLNRSPRK